MRRVAFLVASGATFGALPFLSRLGPVPGALAAVALGIGLAVAASGGAYALAIAAGALGALAMGVLGPVSAPAAGAVFLALVFAERTMRVKSKNGRAVHVLLALAGGAIAGGVVNAFASSSALVLGVATVVSAVLASLPLLVDADDAVAHALETAALELDGAPAEALREGAGLRRTSREIPLDAQTAERVRKTWGALLKLAEARLRLARRPRLPGAADKDPAGAVVAMVDGRIADHVKALARAYTALDTAHAAKLGVDDTALRVAETMGDDLEAVSRAMVEVDGPGGAAEHAELEGELPEVLKAAKA